jgi:uncharacterized membrane protein
VNKNGLEERKRERKVSLWVMRVSGFFLLSFFLVPLINDEGAIPRLSGRANAMDYATTDGWGSWGNADYQRGQDLGQDQSEYGYFAWTELDPYSAFIYGFGDLNCHNKYERSWFINGNQMPVCTRDIGIFFGAFLGGLLFFRRGHNRWTIRDSFLSVFPDDKIKPLYDNDRRILAMWAIAAFAVIPIGLDGGIQMLTNYESNTISRLVTGAPFGLFITWFFCSSLCSRPAKFSLDASKVMLPGNARLMLMPESPDSQDSSETGGEEE